MHLFKQIGEELFQKQIKFHNGRYNLSIPFSDSQRLNWIGSKHWALLEKNLYNQFGSDYFAQEYYVGKVWGHIFGSNILKLVKTERLLADIISTIVERLGFGTIEAKRLDYGDTWLTMDFLDSPISREYIKLFGFSEFPLDFSISGMTAGIQEQLMKRKIITAEIECLASRGTRCRFESMGLEKFQPFIEKIETQKQREVLTKILDIEKKTDFAFESKKILENINKEAVQSELNYLKNNG
jgi:predicted hydrocarbon binding protein